MTAVAVIALSALSIATPKRSEAAIGILLASDKDSQAVEMMGYVLGGLGVISLGIGIAQYLDTPTYSSCTPTAPCSCTLDGGPVAYGGCNPTSNSPSGSYCTSFDEDEDSATYGDCLSSEDQYPGVQTSGSAISGYTSSPSMATYLISGLVLLGTDVAPQIQFNSLDADSAKAMKMTNAEMTAFNQSLPQINLVANDFLTRLRGEAAQGVSAKQIQQDSETMWKTEAKPVLSANAFSAAGKASATYNSMLQSLKK